MANKAEVIIIHSEIITDFLDLKLDGFLISGLVEVASAIREEEAFF